MYTIHAHWDLRWSSNIPAFASELSSPLANVKCYLFVSPAVLCIGKLSKNVEVPVIGQAVIGRDTRPRLTRKSGVGPVGVRVQCHNPSFPQQSLFFFWKAFYSHKYLGCVRERFLDLRYQPKAKKVEIVSCVKMSAVRECFLDLENDIWSK